MALVSVVVPVYRVEEYLNKCIDSVLQQQFKDYEIILVDDGSTDDSSSICDELALYSENNKIPIYVIHRTNGGLSAARNTGIDWTMLCSNNEWICFVDSDDTISEKYLGELYDAAVDNDADLAVCDFMKVDENGNEIYQSESFPTGLLTDKKMLFETMHRYWRTHPAWNKLYKKDLFQDLRFDVGKIHEDEFMIHKAFFLSDRVFFIPDSFYFYLVRSSGIIHTQNRRTKVDAFQAVIDRYWFCKEKGLPLDLKVLGIEYMTLVREFDNKTITRKYKKVYFDYEPNRTIKKRLSFLFFPIYNWYRKRRLG